MTIGDNNKYLRLWYEINKNTICIGESSMNNVNQTLYIPLYGKAYVSRKGIILNDKKAEIFKGYCLILNVWYNNINKRWYYEKKNIIYG